MFKRGLIILSILSFIFILSCEENTIVFPKICTEEPDFEFTRLDLTLVTEISSTSTIIVDRKGYITGDNIILKQDGIIRNAAIGGHICKDRNLSIDVRYNDTADYSRLKLEGKIIYNAANMKLYYCPDYRNCSFVQIGFVSGSYSGSQGQGSFYTPLFTGEFSALGWTPQ